MKLLAPAFSASALLITAAAAVAAPADGHETVGAIPTYYQGIATSVTSIIVFIAVAAFLGVFVWPKISRALEAREQKIRTEIEAAEMAQQQAKSALAQYERNLADARAEAQRMLEDAKAQQQALAADLRAKAEVELNQLRERARRDIDAAKRAALSEVYAQAANVAVDAASKILRREITTSDQNRLVQESLAEMATSTGRNN